MIRRYIVQKLYKNHIFDIIAAIASLIIFVVMIPPFGIARYALNILLAITIGIYAYLYLFPKLTTTHGTPFVLATAEFVIITLVVISLIIQQLHLVEISGVCQTIGLVLWVRGVVLTSVTYLGALKAKKPHKSTTSFIVGMVLTTAGALLFANPIVSDAVLEWVLCLLFLVYALLFGALAFLYWPQRKSSDK